ncbi:HPF/RaiA family ribosome-associated protein [Fictibacillus solisalsi]|uniref:HPF/RaiA family ribosome-associated protein n=1 Tax=Fictibacillus solisalsi TaxID=459525 RepID=UPI000B7DEF7D|nr:HPF/RaiA family ribosome-associated protein [Fictibacillus solisalsi]
MKLQIHGSNLEVTDSIRAYAEQKIGGAVEHFFPDRTGIKCIKAKTKSQHPN